MRKLLIADCNEDYRTALAAALGSQYHVLCCRSGTEALALLYQEHPDIFVLDLMLPELDGLTLLERVSANGICPMVLAATPIFPIMSSAAPSVWASNIWSGSPATLRPSPPGSGT